MTTLRTLFVIDKIEFQYFAANELVTSFWFITEGLNRDWEVYITTKDKLFLRGEKPCAKVFKTFLTDLPGKDALKREKDPEEICLNSLDAVFLRPDPPVDIDYINATYVLDYVDPTKTVVINSSEGVRKANEKLYINNFPAFVPENITTANAEVIKAFLKEKGEIILKPLNKCFGKGVFFLKDGDKNVNSIIDTVTEFGKTYIMAQEYLKGGKSGDKRVIIICGELFEECITKATGEGDFKFNSHKDEYLLKASLTPQERTLAESIAPKLMQDGLYLVGLDVIDNKMIEINVTSPCFFIKEINKLYNTRLEVKIMDAIERLIVKKLNKDSSLAMSR